MRAALKPSDLPAKDWLRKLTFVGAVLASALTIMAAPSFLYSSEEKTEENTIVVPPDAYETHLPKEIYDVCIHQKLLENDAHTNIYDWQNSDGAHRLIIRFRDEEEQYISITYYSERVLNNMRGISIGYKKGALFGYAFLDEQEKKHEFHSPFADEQITDIADFILNKIFPVFP
jgi:hypothetical protein